MKDLHILRCKKCKKEMMPGYDNQYPENCKKCNPEDWDAYLNLIKERVAVHGSSAGGGGISP